MMSDKDIEEFHNLDKLKGLKKSNKYSYIQGKQITDVDTGTRFYDFQGMRLQRYNSSCKDKESGVFNRLEK